MFSIFKSDPSKKLRKAYLIKLEEAMKAQRSGDIQKYASLTSEAEKILVKMETLENNKK